MLITNTISGTRKGFPFKYIWMAILFLLWVARVVGQPGNNDWQQLDNRYQSGELNDTSYLKKVLELAEQSFKDTALKTRMTLYKTIAWRNKEYQPFRVKYFSLLSTNATYTHREGASMYYLQKIEEELQKEPAYINSLNEPRFLMAVYSRNEKANRKKRQEIFLNVLPFLQKLPQLIIKQKIPAPTCINAMTILNMASRLYAGVGDTTMVEKVVGISGQLWSALQEKSFLPRGELMQCNYLYKQVLLTRALLLNNKAEARLLLDDSNTLLTTETGIRPAWARSARVALLKKYVDFFITQQQPDSARHYMHLLNQSRAEDATDSGNAYLAYNAKASALEDHFEEAYQYMSQAYETNDSIISIKTADINNNLYAQMMAEQRAEEVQALKDQRQKRNIIILLAAIAGIICIGLLLVRARHNKRLARQNTELNRLAQIEIAELEAKVNIIQRRLGMELHDEVSSELAYICHLIDKKVIEEKDLEKSNQLQVIAEQTREVYNKARDKSHQWYQQGVTDEHVAFTQSVHRLANYALPDTNFKKVIELDDAVLQYIAPATRVHLLRIIQGAITNIVKHAHASQVSIFIYEDNREVILQIKDDGIGFDSSQPGPKAGIGIRSIKDRVTEINGTFEIISGKKGTELVITLPLNKSSLPLHPGNLANS
ncbi:sensor histidine kinase [Niabella sp. CJ426]|uniref:sensor histidine kinase n=1 Tax=Niabella sp. CJ426 TaxID=3393740 RepID=UPI003D041A1F